MQGLGIACTITRSGADVFAIDREDLAPLQSGFPDEIHDALFELYPAIVRVLTANVSVERITTGSAAEGNRHETWMVKHNRKRLF